MRPLTLTSRISLLALLVVVLGACNLTPSFKATTTRTHTVQHVDHAPIAVSTRNGSVQVIGDPSIGQVVIDAKITCRGATQKEADARLANSSISIIRGDDQTLSIKPIFDGGQPRNGDGASFTVRLPNVSGARLNTGNGSITAKNLAGDLSLDTSNGAVVVIDHDGSATIETSNGKIEVINLGGSLNARTSNGQVAAKGIDGSVDISTSNGAIELVLGPDQSGPIRVDSSNGGVSITVGPGFAGRVQFNTSNGRVTIDDQLGALRTQQIAKRSGTVEFQSDGGESTIATSNGNIRFVVKGAGS